MQKLAEAARAVLPAHKLADGKIALIGDDASGPYRTLLQKAPPNATFTNQNRIIDRMRQRLVQADNYDRLEPGHDVRRAFAVAGAESGRLQHRQFAIDRRRREPCCHTPLEPNRVPA
jgi:hypothetical protein